LTIRANLILTGKPIVLVDAINHALREEMDRNDKIYVFGEDVADAIKAVCFQLLRRLIHINLGKIEFSIHHWLKQVLREFAIGMSL
jgi:hypothetical protein